MSAGSFTILDGIQLRGMELSLPKSPAEITGTELLELAEKRASLSLHSVELPETLKSAALCRLGIPDAAAFRSTVLDHANASSTLRNYIDAIADELRDDPMVVAILDGKTILMFLEDEDDFAMLAENLFMDLDTEDRGKISKNEIKNALTQMGVEMGIPAMSEYPLLTDILKRNEAEGKEELGQSQFALLLQDVLQQLADNLSEKPVVVILHIKIANGSKLKKLLADDKLLEEVVKEIMQEKHESDDDQPLKIQCYLEKHREDLGLPPLESDETVGIFQEIFKEANSQKDAAESEEDALLMVLKQTLEKLGEKLEANPVPYDRIN